MATDRPSRLRADVTTIATTIGERNTLEPDALERTAVWIEERLAAAGKPSGMGVTREPYDAGAGRTVRNVYVDLPGATHPKELVVVGAHYDSVRGCPGANDNGSGVAALLELADAFATRQPRPARTIRFVAFVNEEPPYFQSSKMGSLVHARATRDRSEKVVAMIALETIGCFSDEPGSQQYPPGAPAGLPTVGNFISVVSNVESARLCQEIATTMRAAAKVPVEMASLPAEVPGVGWSDHWSFWQAGYPAVMVTDTAPFRYQHYHRASDTPDKIDYGRMSQVVDAVESAVAALARAQ